MARGGEHDPENHPDFFFVVNNQYAGHGSIPYCRMITGKKNPNEQTTANTTKGTKNTKFFL